MNPLFFAYRCLYILDSSLLEGGGQIVNTYIKLSN